MPNTNAKTYISAIYVDYIIKFPKSKENCRESYESTLRVINCNIHSMPQVIHCSQRDKKSTLHKQSAFWISIGSKLSLRVLRVPFDKVLHQICTKITPTVNAVLLDKLEFDQQFVYICSCGTITIYHINYSYPQLVFEVTLLLRQKVIIYRHTLWVY